MTDKNIAPVNRRTFLKAASLSAAAITMLGIGYRYGRNTHGRDLDPARKTSVLDRTQPSEDPDQLPNIILILTDDLGYGDLSCYGSEAIQTPNLDRLASEGARLTEFYSSSCVCSPARAGLLTGRYPLRTLVSTPLNPTGSFMHLFMNAIGYNVYDVNGIPEDEVLIPALLQRRGYQTGMVGKWHLGDRSPSLPNDCGFDFFYGALFPNDTQPYHIYRDGQIEIPTEEVDQNLLTQLMTRESLAYLRQHADRPFFLYIAHPMPHEPIHASQEFRGRSPAGLYGDVISELDWSTGEILKTIKELELEDNTLVLFTSDNGPWMQGSPGGMRGRKNLPFDGGYRVPMIARWPKAIPAGQVLDGMSMNFDLFSTCLDAAGVVPPLDRLIDGASLLPRLINHEPTPHDMLFYNHHAMVVGIRYKNWKYLRRYRTDNGGYVIFHQGPFLFNLADDPDESYSLIESQPELAADLEEMILEFERGWDKNPRGWL